MTLVVLVQLKDFLTFKSRPRENCLGRATTFDAIAAPLICVRRTMGALHFSLDYYIGLDSSRD